MNSRKFVASLTAQQKQYLTEKNNIDGIQSLILHFGGIILFGSLIYIDIGPTPLFMVFQGIFIIFLFTLLHETVHKSPFASESINRIAGLVCGYLIFLPVLWFRYFHFEHHRNTHIPGKDPELDDPKPSTLSQYLVYVSGISIWKSQIKTLFKNAFGKIDYSYLPKSSHSRIRAEARVMLLVYTLILIVSLVSQTAVLIEIWIIPILLGQPFLRLYLMAEHDRCPFVTNMFENTRTTFTNAFVKKLAWNMPYHVEHHTYPSVPFHKLPALHELIHCHIKESEQGYIKFNRKYIHSFGK